MAQESKGTLDAEQCRGYAAIYGIVGNELLMPMNRSGRTVGVDAGFWKGMPVPSNDNSVRGMRRIVSYANAAQACARQHAEDASAPGVLGASVEYAHLFIGPPRPAANLWETANDPGNEGKVGYGRATVQMRGFLAREGLELSGESNQYEDHMGVELLFLAFLCDKAARGLDAGEDVSGAMGFMAEYIEDHPLKWMPRLRANVDASRPDGFYSPLLEYAHGALLEQRSALSDR